jgi:hypothetical protein
MWGVSSSLKCYAAGVADVNTRFLLTSRNAAVAGALGNRGLELGEFSEDAAVQLLADWLATAPDRLPLDAPDLARECAYTRWRSP